ncbi:MAG: LamG-like jellyroll fold domain-containing protein [Bacteroidota bacterium]
MKQIAVVVTTIAAVLLCRPLPLTAQNVKKIPEVVSAFEEPPLNASAPMFFKLIKTGETSIKKIDHEYEEFKEALEKKEAKEKKEDPIVRSGNQEGEEEFEEGDPYASFYKRWRRGIADFIMPNGMIKTFSQDEMKTLHQRLAQKVGAPAGIQGSSSVNWSLVGPVNTYWKSSDNAAQPAAPWQVNVYTLAAAPSDPTILYCGTETGGLFKTTDKGMNWVSVSSSYNFVASSSSIVVHPTDPNTVYVSIARNIFKTTDGGVTWNSVYYNASANVDAVTMLINPANPQTIIAATAAGILKSINGGATWVSKFANKTFDVEFKPGDTTTVYAVRLNGTNVEFVKSTDGGETFAVSNAGWPTGVTNKDGALLAVTPANPDVVYAAWVVNEAVSGKRPRFIKSTDGGANWTHSPIASLITPFDPDGGQGFYDFVLVASPNDANKVLVGWCSLYRTDNGGTSFTPIGGYAGGAGTFQTHPDMQCAIALGNDTWVATDGGVNYSTDFFTTNSESRTSGIYATEFWGFNQGWNEDIMVGGRYHNGNTVISEDYTYSKALRLGGAEAPTGHLYPGQPRRVSFSDLSTFVLPNTFSGVNLAQSNLSKYPTMDGYGYDYSDLLIHPNYFKTLYIGQGNTLWKSEDNGGVFTAVKTFPLKVRRFVISRSNPNYIYVATESYLYKSTNGGASFTQIASSLGSGDWMMAVSSFNENHVWFVKRNGANGAKVYRTTDGAATTPANITSSVLDNRKVRAVVFDGRNPGSVYIAASPDFAAVASGVMAGGKVFYYNTDASVWDDFSIGLPANMKVLRMFPFYRDGKLRIAGNMGVWEIDLKNPSAPQVQPIASTSIVNCTRDTVQFDDYSVLNHAGASWQWSFSPAPAWIDNANTRNPRAAFTTPGTYDVTLTVTTPGGPVSKTVAGMITVPAVSACTNYDTIPGNALDPQGNAIKTYARTTRGPGITTNTITISAWVRPKGIQAAYAAMFSTETSPGRVAMNFRGSNNELGYHWGSGSNYNISSGLLVPANQWSHVAMVVEPTQVTFYLNGKKVTKTATNASTSFNAPLSFGTMGGGWEGSRTMNGSVDEVCVWNRALTQTEIRQLRHLTKNATNTTNLVAYYQFNETAGATVYDKIAGNDAVISGNGRVVSTAPVGGGVSASQNIIAAGTYSFGATGTSLTTTNAGPNGEVWATRINQNPDAQPDVNGSGNQYWIFNNYGTAASFTALADASLSNISQVDAVTVTDLSKFNLYQRTQNGDSLTWGGVKAHPVSADIATKTLSFDNTCVIDSVSQFAITYGTPTPVLPLSLVDTIPGNALACNGNTDPKFALADALNINTNAISMSAWIKPTGLQSADAGILLCRSGGNTGLFLNQTSGKNYLRFTWGDAGWDVNTSLEVLPNEWSHVGMTVSPTAVTLYVNGKSFTATRTIAAIDFVDGFSIGSDSRSSYNTSRKFLGLVDEVCFWNKTLTTDEIRASRHLTKEVSTPNLVGYYQFNELNGEAIDDKVSSKNAYLINAAQLSASTAPVGRGVSAKQTVTAAGTFAYAAPGADITFGKVAPNGDVWVSRINQSPDQKPTSFNDGRHYWVVNNYGTSSFDPLDSIKFYSTDLVTSSNETTPSQFKLFKRADNATGATWGNSVGTAMNASVADNNSISFPGAAISSFSQFSIASETQILPITLLYFKGSAGENYTNKLEWKIAGTLDAPRIKVQRSLDGTHFSDVGELSLSAAQALYSHNDLIRLDGVVYYRLKWTTFSGADRYSNIVQLKRHLVYNVDVYPNPIQAKGMIAVSLPQEGKVDIDILSTNGQVLQRVASTRLSAGTKTIEFNTGMLASGNYFIRIRVDGQDKMMKKVLVQH